jgi:hypothetical protein
MNIEPYLFVILATVVAMAAYVGTVGRDVFNKLGRKLREKEPPRLTLRLTLGSLIIGDILLIAIANVAVIRIKDAIPGAVTLQASDQTLVLLIWITIIYMSALHAIQWISFAKRIFSHTAPSDSE